MGVLRSVIADIAVVAVLAAFIDMFLPNARNHYGIKLVFGLYFLAILLNPVIDLFTETDFADLDFRELSISDTQIAESDLDGSVLEAAADSLNQEIATKLTAKYEDFDFEVKVELTPEEIAAVEVRAAGVNPGRERNISADIKELLAEDYGVKKRKTEVVFT